MKISDERLVENYRAGDKSAVEELLIRHKSQVRAIARRFFLEGGDAEDLVQEGMCGLYSAIITFDGGSFSSYAYTCIKNRILDAVKKSSHPYTLGAETLESDGEGIASDGFSPEEVLINSESAIEFKRKMSEALSPLEYKAISMYVDGATMNEIAAALNKSYKQTDNAISRAKAKLRKL